MTDDPTRHALECALYGVLDRVHRRAEKEEAMIDDEEPMLDAPYDPTAWPPGESVEVDGILWDRGRRWWEVPDPDTTLFDPGVNAPHANAVYVDGDGAESGRLVGRVPAVATTLRMRLTAAWRLAELARLDPVRAAIEAAAAEARVVLPEGYDVADVLRAGVRGVGATWTPLPGDTQDLWLHIRRGTAAGIVFEDDDGSWCSSRVVGPGDWPRVVTGATSRDTAARALCDHLGIPMPPLPPEGS